MKFKHCFFIVFILILNNSLLLAQKKQFDSLFRVLKTSEDTLKVNVLDEISWMYRNTKPDSAVFYGKKALKLAKELNFSKGIIISHNYIGVAYRNLSKFSEASENYYEALKEAEATNNQEQIAYSIINIGNIFLYQTNYDKALDNFNRALKIAQNLKDKKIMAYAYLNLGRTYRSQKNYDKALECYFRTLKIREELKDRAGIATSHADIAEVYRLQGNLNEALNYFYISLEDSEKLGNKGAMVYSLNNIAQIYKESNQLGQALEFALKSLKLAEQIKSKNDIRKSYLNLSQIYAQSGDFSNAYLFSEKHGIIKDSIFNEESSQAISRLQSEYQSEKQEVKIELLEKDKEIHKQEAEIHKQASELGNSIILLITGFSLLILVVLLILFRSYRHTKVINELLVTQKNEIEITNRELEIKSKVIEQKSEDITASFNYARRIQNAILPFEDQIGRVLPEHFVFFKPKDIVSGDFYWFGKTESSPIYEEMETFTGKEKVLKGFENEKIILAAVDCTGHGVPGAFMSMIANDLLNQIVNEKNIVAADKILTEMHVGIRKALKQSETANRDGMDVSLCVIDKEQKTLQFAGAMNPIVFIQEGVMQVIKGNKMPLGGEQRGKELIFTSHLVDISKPTTFYIYSDGFQDQFGGSEGKKFMIHRFRDLLFEVHQLPVKEQKEKIEERLNQWMGSYAQTDDIMVIGVKV